MSEKRSFVKFLVSLAMPFILIAAGAGMVGLGWSQDLGWLIVPGLVVAGCGVLWGGILLLIHGPLD